MTFDQVKAILDYAVLGWRLRTDREPHLDVHDINGDPPISWATRDALLASMALGYRLIDPALIGNGGGAETKLAIALREGVDGNPRMPRGGPYIDDLFVEKIVAWIDAGCP